MSFDQIDWLESDEGEEVIWKGKPHRNSLYPSFALGILLLPLAGLGLLIMFLAYLNRENTDYVVSSEALYKKTGIMSRKVKKINFAKIQDTSYSQNYFGRVFDYGNVDFSTAGGSRVEMRFRSVPEPKKIQELVGKHIKEHERSSHTKEDSEKELLLQILEELQEINTKLE